MPDSLRERLVLGGWDRGMGDRTMNHTEMLGLVWSVGQPDPARSQWTTSHLGWWNVTGVLKT